MASILLFDSFVEVHMTHQAGKEHSSNLYDIKPLLEGSSIHLHEMPEEKPHYLSHRFEDSKISVSTFCTACPFHLMVNRQMKIVQLGDTVVRMMGAPSNGLGFNSYFRITLPFDGTATFDKILANINKLFSLETTGAGIKRTAAEKKMVSMQNNTYLKTQCRILDIRKPTIDQVTSMSGREGGFIVIRSIS